MVLLISFSNHLLLSLVKKMRSGLQSIRWHSPDEETQKTTRIMIQLRFFCSEITDPSENQKGHAVYLDVPKTYMEKKKKRKT